MITDIDIKTHFKAVIVKSQTCGNCTGKLINLRWADSKGVESVYAADVFVQWSKEPTYRTVRAGGKSAPITQFQNVKEIATWIDANHTIPNV